jgi:hypothetical protein
MAAQTTQEKPVRLPYPTFTEPEPVRGCDVCGACHRQWKQATDMSSPAYDPSHATDLAVEIRRHPHEWKKARR